jgi:hypothetical protein
MLRAVYFTLCTVKAYKSKAEKVQMRLMHIVYLEDGFDHKIDLRLPRIGISTAFYICVRDSSVCLFLNKNIKHLARTTEDYALVRFIGGNQRGSIAIPHRSSVYLLFYRCEIFNHSDFHDFYTVSIQVSITIFCKIFAALST